MHDIRFFAKTHYANSHALIIGINEYKNVSPLSYAVSDAKEIRDVLIGKLGFPTDNR
ncbi:MAG: caspase family protein [Desulfobulbaceae bacterium]|nr:caspase family protein [Desulfobulbaceae bacterium]